VEFMGCPSRNKKKLTEAALVDGTIKAAVLEGDPSCLNVFALSFYVSTTYTSIVFSMIVKKNLMYMDLL
jgi:hypothetical protein